MGAYEFHRENRETWRNFCARNFANRIDHLYIIHFDFHVTICLKKKMIRSDMVQPNQNVSLERKYFPSLFFLSVQICSINFQISIFVPNTFDATYLPYNPDDVENTSFGGLLNNGLRKRASRSPLRYYPGLRGWPRLKILAATVCRGQSYLRFGHAAYQTSSSIVIPVEWHRPRNQFRGEGGSIEENRVFRQKTFDEESSFDMIDYRPVLRSSALGAVFTVARAAYSRVWVCSTRGSHADSAENRAVC